MCVINIKGAGEREGEGKRGRLTWLLGRTRESANILGRPGFCTVFCEPETFCVYIRFSLLSYLATGYGTRLLK